MIEKNMNGKKKSNFVERIFENYYNQVLSLIKKLKKLELEKKLEKIEKYFFGIVGLIAIVFGVGLFFYSRGFENQGEKYLVLFAILAVSICLIEIFRKKDSWLALAVYLITIFLGAFRFIFKFDNIAPSIYVLLAIFIGALFVLSVICNKISILLIAIFICFAYTVPVGKVAYLTDVEKLASFALVLILTLVFILVAYLSDKLENKLEPKNLSSKNNLSKVATGFAYLFLCGIIIELPVGNNFMIIFLIYLLAAMTSILFGLITKRIFVRLVGIAVFLFSFYKILFEYCNMRESISINDTVFIAGFGFISLLIFFIYKKLECRSLAMQNKQ